MVYNQGMRLFHALFFCALCLSSHPVSSDMDISRDFTLQKFASVPGARILAVAAELAVIFVDT